MTPLYAYSLVPVLSVALLLLFTVLRSEERLWSLAIFCASIAVWTASLLLISLDLFAGIGQRMAACGAFVVAAYLHVTYDVTHREGYALVAVAYAIAAALTLAGVLLPGLLYDPVSLRAGPMFWPGMALAIGAVCLPLGQLVWAARRAQPRARRLLKGLVVAGVLCYVGAWTNAYMLAHGVVLPYGMIGVLASLFVLANVVADRQAAAERKILDRSLWYSALTSLVWASFLFGSFLVINEAAYPLIVQYRLGAFFLLFMAALAFEPLRQHVQEEVARRLLPARAGASSLADALVAHEVRVDQAERLATLGQFTSAIAHEVRNPLGVLRANLKLLERTGADPEILTAMRAQIERASTFVDDLVLYGRPRPLEFRDVRVDLLLHLASSTAMQARQHDPSLWPVTILEPDVASELPQIEADQNQLLQVFVILLDNAILAMQRDDLERREIALSASPSRDGLHIVVEDSGPGIPGALEATLFEPFVTGRKREGKSAGTGLGLAIARSVVERHGGSLTASRSELLGGARFDVALRLTPPLLQEVTP
ncbi:MAG: ATP-binding protein [Myxococcota bacterium]